MNRKFLPRIRGGLSAAAFAGFVAGLSLTAAGAAPQRPAAPTVVGMWEQVNDDGKVGSWFHIYERDGIYEGRIVRMFPRRGDKPNPICTKCPGDQKNQPTLGLTLIKGMQRKGLNYENGTVLDPRDGSVYQARMELSPDGQKLMMRGFLGIDLFGHSQIWRRLPDSALAEATGGVTPPGVQNPTTGSSPAAAKDAPSKNAQPAAKR
jgi:hypothetical protein